MLAGPAEATILLMPLVYPSFRIFLVLSLEQFPALGSALKSIAKMESWSVEDVVFMTIFVLSKL